MKDLVEDFEWQACNIMHISKEVLFICYGHGQHNRDLRDFVQSLLFYRERRWKGEGLIDHVTST